MVISTLRILPSSKRRRETLEILNSVRAPIMAQPGCVSCHVYQEEDSEGELLFWEQWENDEALQRHVRSDIYRRILAAIELSSRRPEVCFHGVSETHGMELIQELRGVGEV